MRTENLVKLMVKVAASNVKVVKVYNTDRECDNETIGDIKLDEPFKANEVDSEIPTYGSYVILLSDKWSDFDEIDELFNKLTSGSEDYPYINWRVDNVAKNARFKHADILQVGCFVKEMF